MPSTIPYDPSLVLGSVITDKALDIVKNFADIQGPVDAAQDTLNGLISAKQSLDATRTELVNLGVDTSSLNGELSKLNESIEKAAKEYARQKVGAEAKLGAQRSALRQSYAQIESPIDFLKTEMKTMPLAADSMNVDVRFFAVDINDNQGLAHGQTIAAFIADSNNFLGGSTQEKLSKTVGVLATDMVESKGITGTLVISAASTHKNASILAPFILNVEKAIKTWNHIHPDEVDRLNPTNTAEVKKIAMKDDHGDRKRYSIISGTTFGSSFVGMLHIVDMANTDVGQKLQVLGSALQSQMDAGAWFSRSRGEPQPGMGDFANQIDQLLKTQNITSHVSLVTLGVPSVFANAAENMASPASLDRAFDLKTLNALADLQQPVADAAKAARTSQNPGNAQLSDLRDGLSTLDKIDTHRNKTLDVHSLGKALDGYLQKVEGAGSGVPINYYLKDIDKKMLAEMWVAKYFPGEYMAIKYED